MRRLFLAAAAAAAAGVWLVACSRSRQPTAPDMTPVTTQATPEMRRFEADHPHTHIQLPRGFARAAARTAKTGIFYHGGPLLTAQTNVVAVYWSAARIYNGGPTPGSSGTGSHERSDERANRLRRAGAGARGRWLELGCADVRQLHALRRLQRSRRQPGWRV